MKTEDTKLAERVAQGMLAQDAMSRALGISILEVRPGYARLKMTVRPDMANSHSICHGGAIFTLAHSAFAFACNTYNRSTRASASSIPSLTPPRLGHHLPPTPPPLEPTGRATQADLRALQTARLKWSLQHDYDRVRHYRGRFSALGLHPSNLHTLEDLAKFPFAVKDDLRRNYPFWMLAVAREEIIRIHASSGTTGKPTIVGYTRNDIENWSTLMARSIRAAGGRSGQIVLVSYGYGLFTGGLGAHYGAERLGCAVIPMSGGQTEKQVQMITDLQPSIIMMTPSYMLTIADEFARQGLDATKSSLRVGIFGAEPWSESLRTEIETRFHMDAVDIYGLSEVMGPGVAYECVETKYVLIIWEDHFYPEITDPETGAVLPEGTYGELVLTSLTKEGLPLIRYRNRDLAPLPPSPARSMRRIGRIVVRSDDMLIIRGVNVYASHIE